MKCTSCSAEVPASAKFCPECGAKIVRKSFCPECGAEASPGAKFCAECGTKLAAPQTAGGVPKAATAKPQPASTKPENTAPAEPANKPDPEWNRFVSERSGREKWKGWSDISSTDWSFILVRHPEYAGKCDKWKQFKSNDWALILCHQPQFAEKCDKWEEFEGIEWSLVLCRQPQFADKCDWSKLKDYEWDDLLKDQPQLAKYRPGNADPDDGATSEFDPTFAGRVASQLNAYMRSFGKHD